MTSSSGHMTPHSSLYMKHILSSSQFSREQLHHVFQVAHEMRMAVSRVGSLDIMKVGVGGVASGCGFLWTHFCHSVHLSVIH